MIRHAPQSPLFPYTTLFRSVEGHAGFALLTGGENSREHAVELFNRKILADVSVRARVERSMHLLFVIADAGENDDRKDRIQLSDRKSTRLNSSHRCISYAVF